MIQKNKFYPVRFVLLIAMLLLTDSVNAIGISRYTDSFAELNYPVPPKNERSLFYVQRNKNTNAIVYETNLLPNGEINQKDPVRIYWISYANDSAISELTYVQRHYAYGIESKAVEGKPGHFVLNFVSYNKKKFYLVPVNDGKVFQALTMINGKMAILDRVFIHLNGGTFWFPVIEDIEVKGRDAHTLKEVVEHIKP